MYLFFDRCMSSLVLSACLLASLLPFSISLIAFSYHYLNLSFCFSSSCSALRLSNQHSLQNSTDSFAIVLLHFRSTLVWKLSPVQLLTSTPRKTLLMPSNSWLVWKFDSSLKKICWASCLFFPGLSSSHLLFRASFLFFSNTLLACSQHCCIWLRSSSLRAHCVLDTISLLQAG